MTLECQRQKKPTIAGTPTPWSRGMDQVGLSVWSIYVSVCLSVCLIVCVHMSVSPVVRVTREFCLRLASSVTTIS